MTKAMNGAAEIGYHFHEGLLATISTFIPNNPYTASVEPGNHPYHAFPLLTATNIKGRKINFIYCQYSMLPALGELN